MAVVIILTGGGIYVEKVFSDIIQFLLPQNDTFLYIFLFASAIVENLFPPIPGDTITGLGAFLVGTGRLNYWLVYASTTAGSVMGFMSLFFLGRFLEREFFMKRNYSFFSADTIIATEAWFKKYGYIVVLANRFVPGIRSAVSIVSGISRLNPVKVALLSLASAAIWNIIWIHVGFTLGNNWELVKHKLGVILKNYNIAVGSILTVAVLIFLAVRFLKNRGKANGNN